jgi:ribosomal protein S18 acetylase RimI-like enzyme
MSGSLTLRLLRLEDLDEVTAIYLEYFPHLVQQWYSRAESGKWLYRDLLHALWLANAESFFVAEADGRIAGYLLLTQPNASVPRAAVRSGFWKHIAAHGLSGKYGVPWRAFRRAASAIRGRPRTPIDGPFAGDPHIEVIVVRRELAGRGIGVALLEQAREFCRSRYGRLWLHVERTNSGAIRFYEKTGFRQVASDDFHHVMQSDLIQRNPRELPTQT